MLFSEIILDNVNASLKRKHCLFHVINSTNQFLVFLIHILTGLQTVYLVIMEISVNNLVQDIVWTI